MLCSEIANVSLRSVEITSEFLPETLANMYELSLGSKPWDGRRDLRVCCVCALLFRRSLRNCNIKKLSEGFMSKRHESLQRL